MHEFPLNESKVFLKLAVEKPDSHVVSGIMEQNKLRILDCGLQIAIQNYRFLVNPQSEICIPKSHLFQHSITPSPF
jgi:hypothetical protein